MQTAYLVFLYTAEEKSITRGAARAFVSQQNASRHLQNLEKQFGAKLFSRQPFALTRTGEILLAGLRELYVKEQKVDMAVREAASGQSGLLRIGCNAARARFFFRDLLKDYGKKYPKVRFAFSFADTLALMQKLQEGSLDFVLGVNHRAQPNLHCVHLFEDRIFFAALPELVQKFFPEKKAGDPFSLPELADFPLSMNLPDSTLRQVIQRQEIKENLLLVPRYECSDFYWQMEIARQGLAGFFLPRSLLPLLHSHSGKTLHFWPLSDVAETMSVDLFSNVSTVRPSYEKDFIQSVQAACRKK